MMNNPDWNEILEDLEGEDVDFKAELYEAALEVVDLFPGIGYDEWADKLLVMYPAEVIDALGVDEEEVEKGLREIWEKMETEGV